MALEDRLRVVDADWEDIEPRLTVPSLLAFAAVDQLDLRREPGNSAYVLFGDRIRPGTITYWTDPAVPPGSPGDFHTRRGRRELRTSRMRYGVALSRR
jgi:hypothetical protein